MILGWAMAPQLWLHQEGGGQSFYTVSKFMVEEGECKGLELADGRKFIANRAVVTTLDPKQSFLRLVEPQHLDEDFLRMVGNFRFGKVSIVRVHYALHGAPYFNNGDEMSKTPFQRIFGSLDAIEQQYSDIALDIPPKNPFLWSACWTKEDPTRAPAGKHTLIVDTFVSNKIRGVGKWTDALAKQYVEQAILPKFREYTRNMSDSNIIAEYVDHAQTLARDNWSLVDGTATGGERIMAQSGFFRPFPGYSQYRSPIKNLWMTGPSTHPDGAITAMGTITANEMLKEFGGVKKEEDEFDF